MSYELSMMGHHLDLAKVYLVSYRRIERGIRESTVGETAPSQAPIIWGTLESADCYEPCQRVVDLVEEAEPEGFYGERDKEWDPDSGEAGTLYNGEWDR